MKVEFASGTDEISGEFRLPQSPGPHPGLVLIPDVGGLSPFYEDCAQRLAEGGFATLALNLYSRGEQPDLSSLDSIFKFLHDLPDPQVLRDVQAALQHLAGRSDVDGSRLGVTGFCVGGEYTILAACSCAGISAAVAWYGMLRLAEIDERNPEHPLDALDRLSCPLLGLFGGEDAIVPQADVEEFRLRGAACSHEVETVVYPGAGHAFANEGRPDAYRAEAAADAWQRTLDFFQRHLG